MSTLLITGAEVVATMDDAGTEVAGGSILVRDGAIAWVGASADAARAGGRRGRRRVAGAWPSRAW